MVNAEELEGGVKMEQFHQAAIDVSPGIDEEPQNHSTEDIVEIRSAKELLGDYCVNRNSFAFAWIENLNELNKVLPERARALYRFGRNGGEENSSANAENLAAQSSILQIPPPSNNDDDNTYILTRSLCSRTKLAPRKQERPFPCPQCGRSFMNRHHLERHQLDVHSQERPFECKKCGSAFKRKSDMLKHRTRYCRGTKKRIPNFQVNGDAGSPVSMFITPATKEGERAIVKEEVESDEPMESKEEDYKPKPKNFIDEYKHWLSIMGMQKCKVEAL